MALNMMGVGFSFGADTRGVVSAQNQVLKGFDNISSAVGELAHNFKSSSSSFEGWGSSIANQVGQVNTAVSSLDPKMMEATRGVAGLESGLRALSGETQPAAGSLENFGKSMGDFTAKVDKSASAILDMAVEMKETREATEKARRAAEAANKEQVKTIDLTKRLHEISSRLRMVVSNTRMSNIMQGFNLNALNSLGDKLGSLGGGAGELTTSLEATGVALGKSAREIGTRMGKSGKELDKFTKKAASMAYGLNIGAGETSKAMLAFERSSEGFAAIGLKSAKDVAKAFDVAGIDSVKFGEKLELMNKTLGMSSEDIKGMVGSFQELGKETHDVPGSLEGMVQMMDKLQTAVKKTGATLTGKEMAEFGKDTAAATNIFFQFTKNGDQARAMSGQLAESILGARKSFAELATGANSEFPDFIKNLGIATGDSRQAFAAMSEGPAQFMQRIGQLRDVAKDQGKDMQVFDNRMKAWVKKTLGGNDQMATAIVGMSKKGEKGLGGMASAIKEATADFAKLAKSFRTGLTRAENFDRAAQALRDQLRSVTRSDVDKMLFKTNAEFKQLGKTLREQAAKGGPWGALIKSMSRIDQLGAAGLFPDNLVPQMMMAGKAAQQLAPSISVLHGLGIRMTSPFSMLAAAVGVLGVRFASLYKGIKKNEIIGTRFNTALLMLSDDIGNFANKIPEYVDQIVGFFTGLGDQMGEGLETAGVGRMGEAMKALGGAVWEGMVKIFKAIPWDKVGQLVVDGLQKVWDIFADLPWGKIAGTFLGLGVDMVKWIGQGIMSSLSEKGVEGLIPWSIVLGGGALVAAKVFLPMIATIAKLTGSLFGLGKGVVGVGKKLFGFRKSAAGLGDACADAGSECGLGDGGGRGKGKKGKGKRGRGKRRGRGRGGRKGGWKGKAGAAGLVAGLGMVFADDIYGWVSGGEEMGEGLETGLDVAGGALTAGSVASMVAPETTGKLTTKVGSAAKQGLGKVGQGAKAVASRAPGAGLAGRGFNAAKSGVGKVANKLAPKALVQGGKSAATKLGTSALVRGAGGAARLGSKALPVVGQVAMAAEAGYMAGEFIGEKYMVPEMDKEFDAINATFALSEPKWMKSQAELDVHLATLEKMKGKIAEDKSTANDIWGGIASTFGDVASPGEMRDQAFSRIEESRNEALLKMGDLYGLDKEVVKSAVAGGVASAEMLKKLYEQQQLQLAGPTVGGPGMIGPPAPGAAVPPVEEPQTDKFMKSVEGTAETISEVLSASVTNGIGMGLDAMAEEVLPRMEYLFSGTFQQIAYAAQMEMIEPIQHGLENLVRSLASTIGEAVSGVNEAIMELVYNLDAMLIPLQSRLDEAIASLHELVLVESYVNAQVTSTQDLQLAADAVQDEDTSTKVIYAAINRPAWYADYSRLFNDRFNRLEKVLLGQGVSARAGAGVDSPGAQSYTNGGGNR